MIKKLKHKTLFDYDDKYKNLSIEEKINDYIKKQKVEIHWIAPDSIVFAPEARFKCMNCAGYHSSFHCPPFTPNAYKAKEIFKKYEKFVLIIVRTDMKDILKNLKMKTQNRITQMLFSQAQASRKSVFLVFNTVLEIRGILNSEGYNVLVFGSGGCRWCMNKGCAIYSNEKCRHPDKAIPAPEGWSIDVYSTLLKNKIKIEIPPRYEMTQVGMIVYKKK